MTYKMVNSFAMPPARSRSPSSCSMITEFCTGGTQPSINRATLTMAHARVPAGPSQPILVDACNSPNDKSGDRRKRDMKMDAIDLIEGEFLVGSLLDSASASSETLLPVLLLLLLTLEIPLTQEWRSTKRRKQRNRFSDVIVSLRSTCHDFETSVCRSETVLSQPRKFCRFVSSMTKSRPS